MSHNSRKLHKICHDLFDARVSFLFPLSVNPYAASRHLWGSAARIYIFFFTSESKIVDIVDEVLKNKTWAGL